MKQVININFQGRVVPIEVSAFELLKNYTESLSRYFSNEDGKEEIINDIESRIGELFQERLKNGITCITDDDVNAIIKSMGRPEDFENAEEASSQQSKASQQSSSQRSYQNTNKTFAHKRLYRDEDNKVVGGVCSGVAHYFGIDAVIVRILAVVLFGVVFVPYIILWIALPSKASTEIGGTRKKLYRDGDDKIVAGVCSGIGNYFGINPWIPRIIFLVPFLSFVFHWRHMGFGAFPNFVNLSFSPGTLFVYIILWLVIPEAITTAEKLEMKGEKIDMNSIKNSVMEEIKGVKQRAEKFGSEAKAFATEKGKTVGADIGNVARRSSRSFGDIIVLIVKGFAYFIMGCAGFALVMALFGIAIASVGIFPLKDFVLRDGWQNILAWGTLIFFIALPVIGVITWIIRRLAKIKSNGKIMRLTFVSLWIIGWVCVISLIALVAKDFKATNNMVMQEIVLPNPAINKLEVTNPDDMISQNYKRRLHFAFFENLDDEDSFYVNNVHFRLVKSKNDSFQVSIIKQANGRSRMDAANIASRINYDLNQTDSLLKTPLGISIDKKNKFRNQHVIITIAVPVGKRIKIDQSIWDNPSGKFNIGWNNDDWDDYWGDEEHGWTTDVEYLQKADGLYKLNGEKADASNDDNNDMPKIKIDDNGVEINSGHKRVKVNKNGVLIDPDDVDDINEKKLDSLEDRQDKQKDSLERELEKQKEKLLKQTHQDASITPIGSPIISSLM